MLALEYSKPIPPYSLVESRLSQDGRFGWIMAIRHPEKDKILEEIVAEIILTLRSVKAHEINRMEAEKWLKEFFADLHWKLHASLRKSDLAEKGLSLFFALIYEQEIFYVQFGRIFCGIADGKKLSISGAAHKEYRMQTFEKLNLLGFASQDIRFKIHRELIKEEQRFIALSSNLAPKIFDAYESLDSMQFFLDSNKSGEDSLWLMLTGKPELAKPQRRRLSRLQFSTIIILFLMLIATLYMIFGNRVIEQFFHKTRLDVQHTKSLRLEQIPNTLVADTQHLLKYINRIVNLPAREIELGVTWSATLPYTVTSTPVFSRDHIYLSAGDNLLAFDKKSREMKWKKSFESHINGISFSDAMLIVYLEKDRAFGIRDDGNVIWEQDLPSPQEDLGRLKPSRISPEDDPRLSRPINVVPSLSHVTILDPTSGESLSSISFTDEIKSLSAYDNYAYCFYAVVDDGILCINLKIDN